MPYSKRIPPIKIKLSIYEFNVLVEMLTNMIDYENESISKKSEKMKDKLLRYSVPIIENEDTIVDIRCYPNEIVDLFYILFYGAGDGMEVETNYFDVLMKVREKISNEKANNE